MAEGQDLQETAMFDTSSYFNIRQARRAVLGPHVQILWQSERAQEHARAYAVVSARDIVWECYSWVTPGQWMDLLRNGDKSSVDTLRKAGVRSPLQG